MRVIVTGGAGFVGSHLVLGLLAKGNEVIVADAMHTGSQRNWDELEAAGATLVPFDVRNERHLRVVETLGHAGVDRVYHLASPASPVAHDALGMTTIETCAWGTRNVLEMAKRLGARFMLASTSEVYGDPLVYPQSESYRGNVDPCSPRSVYDESKRFAETLSLAYARWHDVDVRIVRLFNGYGPRMRFDDGRVVPNFVVAALTGEPLVVSGDGSQTRSFCYIGDLVEGFQTVMEADYVGPVNLGNPGERTMRELAEYVLLAAAVPFDEHDDRIVYGPTPVDDPQRRCPDIGRACSLGWEPKVDLVDGIERTVKWYREALATA